MKTEYREALPKRSVQTAWLSKGKMRLMAGTNCSPVAGPKGSGLLLLG